MEGALLVKYKVRSFYEKDTGSIGADVIIFDDAGDVVDTLLITTESTYNDLIRQLEGIDEKYLDKNDISNILSNTAEEIVEINATLLDGHSSDYFATNDHNHDLIYAPLNHTNITGNEGSAGHTKVINNVSRGSFVQGEALSAYQGKLLSDRINTAQNTANSKMNGGWWTLAQWDGTNQGGSGYHVFTNGQLVCIRLWGRMHVPTSWRRYGSSALVSNWDDRPAFPVVFYDYSDEVVFRLRDNSGELELKTTNGASAGYRNVYTTTVYVSRRI